MSLRFTLIAAAVVFLACLSGGAAYAQVVGYNPYTGTGGVAGAA